MGRVDDKVALISGGASGIGAADARSFVTEGASVVIGDIIDEEGHALAAELGEAARFVHLDVTQPEDWKSAVSTAVTEFGKLNVLVNNAGIGGAGVLEEYPLPLWQKILDVNLTGSFVGMQTVVRPMTTAGGGSIINMSSVAGLRGDAGNHAYVASKWALRGITKSAALELAPSGIRVNSIHPGQIRTPMTKQLPDDIFAIPMGRVADPSDVSALVVFLASDESSYCTGAEFVVDGGLNLTLAFKNADPSAALKLQATDTNDET